METSFAFTRGKNTVHHEYHGFETSDNNNESWHCSPVACLPPFHVFYAIGHFFSVYWYSEGLSIPDTWWRVSFQFMLSMLPPLVLSCLIPFKHHLGLKGGNDLWGYSRPLSSSLEVDWEKRVLLYLFNRRICLLTFSNKKGSLDHSVDYLTIDYYCTFSSSAMFKAMTLRNVWSSAPFLIWMRQLLNKWSLLLLFPSTVAAYILLVSDWSKIPQILKAKVPLCSMMNLFESTSTYLH